MQARLVSGGMWTLAATLVNGVAVIGGSALLARLLAPADFGGYLLAASIVSVGGLLASLGLNRSVVRLVAQAVAAGDAGRAEGIARRVIGVGVAGSLLCAGLLYAGPGEWIARAALRSAPLADSIGLIGAWLVPATLALLVAETFRGFHDIRRAAIYGAAFGNVVSIGLYVAVALITGAATLRLAIALSLAGSAAGAAFGLVALRRRLGPAASGIPVGIRSLLATSLPLWVTTVTTYALSQSDIWLVGIFRDPGEVAVYGAAAKLMLLVAIPLAVVNGVIQPVVTEFHGHGRRDDLQRLLRVSASIAGVPALLILGIYVLLAGPLLATVFGDVYASGAPYLAILAVGQFVNVWTGSCGVVLIMTGHERTLMTVTVASGGFTVLLNLLLVQQFGATGVAAGTALGVGLQNLVLWMAARRRAGVWTNITVAGLRESAVLAWQRAKSRWN